MALAFQRQEEKIHPSRSSGPRLLPENQRGAVRRDSGWKLRDIAQRQLFDGSGPIGRPPENASRGGGPPELGRTEDHVPSVRCPDAILFERGPKRQAREVLTHQIP